MARIRAKHPLHWSAPALLALALLVPPASADTRAPLDARMSQRFTHALPGARTGWTLDAALRAPSGLGRAPSQRRIEIVLPRGTRLDVAAVRACQASDLALLVDGGGACPRRSRVGGGSADLDAGPGLTATVPVGVYAAPGALVLLYGAEHGAVLNVARGRVTGEPGAASRPRSCACCRV